MIGRNFCAALGLACLVAVVNQSAIASDSGALDTKRPLFVGSNGAILCPDQLYLWALSGDQVDRSKLFRVLIGHRPTGEERGGYHATRQKRLDLGYPPDNFDIADDCRKIEPGTQLYDAKPALGGLLSVNIVAGEHNWHPAYFARNELGNPAYITKPEYLTNSQ